MRIGRFFRLVTGLAVALAATGAALAVVGEATALRWCSASRTCLQWDTTPQAANYRVYRGVRSGLPNLLNGNADSCLEMSPSAPTTGSFLTVTPPPGGMFWFLVRANSPCGEGTAGSATSGVRIVNSTGSCTASCMNNVKDGLETDRDCGGPICAPCIVGKICVSRSDCESRDCLASHCQPPTCTDGQLNGTETDIDCGGDTCLTCANGRLCCAASDCGSSHCVGGTCQP